MKKQISFGVIIVVLIVQGCFLLQPLLSVYKHKNIVNMSNIRAMANKISHLEENQSQPFIENDIGRNFRSKGLSTKETMTKSLSSAQTTGKKMSPKSSTEGQCHYRVQLYYKNDQHSRKAILKNVVKQANGSEVERAIPCGNDCNIELSLADEVNKFEGMDAVVFHFTSHLLPRPLPALENPNQTWVFFSLESPRRVGGGAQNFTNLPVHATWTFHWSSEIVLPYGFYRLGVPMTNQTKSPEEWIKGKSKLVAWMVSNCGYTSWPRMDFVNELKKFIPIDIYGKCGTLRCSPRWSPECVVDLMRQYKFYLALENSECGDYITEKLWQKPLMTGVVPIVYGPNRKVYEDLAPPNSFIYIGDYKNLQELADYLKLLDSKPDLYAQYLEWQYKGSIGIPHPAHGLFDPSIFCNVIPIIKKVKRGELKRELVRNTQYARACRPRNKSPSVSNYGVGNWNPW